MDLVDQHSKEEAVSTINDTNTNSGNIIKFHLVKLIIIIIIIIKMFNIFFLFVSGMNSSNITEEGSLLPGFNEVFFGLKRK